MLTPASPWMARGWAWSCGAAWAPGAPSSASHASICWEVASSLVEVATAPWAAVAGTAPDWVEPDWVEEAERVEDGGVVDWLSAAKAALHRANHAAVIETNLIPICAMRSPPLWATLEGVRGFNWSLA